MMTKRSGLLVSMMFALTAACGGDDMPFGAGGAGAMGGQSAQGGAGGAAGAGGAGGMQGEPDWSCLGQVPDPVFAPGSAQATFYAATQDATLVGADITICTLSDLLCDNPLAVGVTDDSGSFSADISTAEAVFAQVESSSSTPVLAFVNGPVSATESIAVAPLTALQLTAFLEAAGAPTLPGAGHVVAHALDCNGVSAPDVRFDIDNATENTRLAYLGEDGVPDSTLSATSTHGGAFFANLPPGLATVTATLENNAVVSLRTVVIRGDWLSQAAPSSPTPRPQQ